MSEKKIYKVVVESTFYEAKKKRNGELGQSRKRTRQQMNGEIAVDTLADALDIILNAVHLAIKEYGDRDRYELRFLLADISVKCKECGALLESPRMIANGYYYGELFMVTINHTRRYFSNIECIKSAVLNAYDEAE